MAWCAQLTIAGTGKLSSWVSRVRSYARDFTGKRWQIARCPADTAILHRHTCPIARGPGQLDEERVQTHIEWKNQIGLQAQNGNAERRGGVSRLQMSQHGQGVMDAMKLSMLIPDGRVHDLVIYADTLQCSVVGHLPPGGNHNWAGKLQGKLQIESLLFADCHWETVVSVATIA